MLSESCEMFFVELIPIEYLLLNDTSSRQHRFPFLLGDFHKDKKPGKIEINSSKSMTTKRDLALAYSPGVAAPVRMISENPEAAYDYTSKGNLVAVISNGSAILGMGNLGALASKPVMEGKAVLFKRFADIDSIDLEIDCKDSDEIINSIKNFACSFGGINLEDIAAPDCFIIEEKLKELVEFQIENGTTGIVPCGTTGESPTLDYDEHNKVVDICVQAANKRVPIIAGTGSNSTSLI